MTEQEEQERVDDRHDDDAIGRWHGVYDPSSDEEIDWLMYIAKMLSDKEEKEN